MTGGVVPSQPWAPQCSTCSSGRKSGKKRCRVALLGKVAVQCSCHGWWLPSLLLHETPTAEVRLKVAQSPERQLALFHDGTGYAVSIHRARTRCTSVPVSNLQCKRARQEDELAGTKGANKRGKNKNDKYSSKRPK